MKESLVNLNQLRAAAQEAKGLIGTITSKMVEALEEMDSKKQDISSAVTIERVNEAIQTAIIDSWDGSY